MYGLLTHKNGKDIYLHETDAYVDVNWEMSGRDSCVHHSESGMEIQGERMLQRLMGR